MVLAFYLNEIITVLCHLQEKATPFVLLSSVTANFRVTQCTRPSIRTGTKPLHCKWDIWKKKFSALHFLRFLYDECLKAYFTY